MRSIVAGIETPDISARVLERALLEAETTHRPLCAIGVWSPQVLYGDVMGMSYLGLPSAESVGVAAQQTAEELLDKALRERTSLTRVTATAAARQGDAGQVLVTMSNSAGLVVVGARSHGSLVSALLGSATGHVLHHAACPVMVVPATAGPGRFGRVVVGVDGTPASRAALRWAADAADRHGCALLAVHALQLTPAPVMVPVEQLFPDYLAMTQAWLVALVAEEVAQQPITCQVVDGPASAVLLAAAGPDELLVVGSRGRGGFAGLILGSVATQCAQHSRGAVVVVRDGEERLDP